MSAAFFDAFSRFLPILLVFLCQKEEQFLLLTHCCKMLVEYAVQSAQSQVLVNSKVLCQGLRKAIEDRSPMETMKNCADSLLALARCFEEAKTTFLDLSRQAGGRRASLEGVSICVISVKLEKRGAPRLWQHLGGCEGEGSAGGARDSF